MRIKVLEGKDSWQIFGETWKAGAGSQAEESWWLGESGVTAINDND